MTVVRKCGPILHVATWFTTSPEELATPRPTPERTVVRRAKRAEPDARTLDLTSACRQLAEAWGAK